MLTFIQKLAQWRHRFRLAEANHSDDTEEIVSWCGILCSKFQIAASTWLKTFVIIISPDNGQWHFRTLFVAEITILPILLSFLFVSWWVLNRNTRMRKTKGSSIPHKEDDKNCDNDEKDEETLERQKLQALLKAYDVELDDDDDGDDETILSVDSYLEDSDYEDDTVYSRSNSTSINTDATAARMFLSKEKTGLWKVVKEIPILSFFNEEAMEMCMNDIEYITLAKTTDSLWDEGKFDGSLFYVVEGRIRVNFLDFKASSVDQRAHGKHKEVASVIHEEDTVVTSLLALIEGMIRCHLDGRNSLGLFLGPLKKTTAQAMEDCTRLLRIPPSCFSRILDRFPETILRIIQTTLNRTQRVTVQTLVRCCGLRQELLVRTNNQLKTSMLAIESSHWSPLQAILAKMNMNSNVDLETIPDHDKKCLIKNACAAFASVVSIEESATIEVLEEKCSLIALNTQGDESSRILLEAGSNHDSCYLLLQGIMEIGLHLPLDGFSSKQLQNDANAWEFQRTEIISPGSILGESALFTTDINLFEIRGCVSLENCNDPSILLRIPKDVYIHLIVKHPQAMAASLVPILSVLSPVVHLLTWTTEWMHVEAAREIVQKGSPCNSLYIVLNGRLRATNRSKARNRVLGGASSNIVPPEEYGRGKIFGQVGSLANVDWPFDVFAIRQSELAKVPIKTLEVVVQNFPHAGLFLARVVASHVESLYFSKREQTAPSNGFAYNISEQFSSNETGRRRSHITKQLPYNLPSYGLNLATIAVVPLSYNFDVKRFCNTLCKAMQTIAPCKLLTKSLVKQDLGGKVCSNRNALHDLKMTRYLADVEENNRVVIYQADNKFTFWTRLSILQADCILLVVDSQQAPETSRIEQTLTWAYEAMDVRIELVVVGKEESSPDENDDTDIDVSYFEEDDISVSDHLNNWSESRKWIAGHHLVRAPFGRYRMDFRRMCRRISGRSIGLVLGAGGARGIAHLGVIRALQEAGITVDMVGGTSQGAFAGALFAKSPDDYNQVLEAFRKMAADASSMKEKLLDLTLPMASMFAGRRFNRSIKKLLGKLRIQDLVLNFFCVSVDLQNQNTVVHTKGLLWKYVRASMGLTGYLPPISEDGQLLVDGGYLNSVPADVMRYKMGARTVIAVDVSTECKREYFEYGTHLSGWWVLCNSWNPFVKTVKVPSMGDISDMLIWVSSEQHRKSVKIACDLHLTPPIQDIGTLEYDKFDEIVEKSYVYAKPIVDEWVRKNPWLVSQVKDLDSA